MLRILHGTNYDFIKRWRIAVAVTVVFIVAGLSFLAIHGLNRSIEFTGGTLMQLEFAQPPDVGQIRSTLDAAGVHGAEIQQSDRDSRFELTDSLITSNSGAGVYLLGAGAGTGADAACTGTETESAGTWVTA